MKIFFSKKDLNLGNNSNDKPLYLDVMNNPIDRVTILYYKQNINKTKCTIPRGSIGQEPQIILPTSPHPPVRNGCYREISI